MNRKIPAPDCKKQLTSPTLRGRLDASFRRPRQPVCKVPLLRLSKKAFHFS